MDLILSFSRRPFLRGIGCFVAVCILGVSFLVSLRTVSDNVQVHFINVGYGDAILIEMPDDQAILIDSGEEEYADRLIEYLVSRRIKELRAVILTHPHKNHFGGFSSVIKQWPVGQFYINGDIERAEDGYADLINAVKAAEIPIVILKEGNVLPLAGDRAHLGVLHPSRLTESANENAFVFQLTFKETSFLFTSDIQLRQQKQLLARYPAIGSAGGIQVPHHGGEIDDEFANAFDENTIFIVSTGANEYEKPFLQELGKLKGRVLRTDLQGSIVLQSDGHQIEVVHE